MKGSGGATVVQYDSFLTHDWGTAEDNYLNHERVKKINQYLKDKGIVTWFDADRLRIDIRNQIIAGIGRSKIILVFITRRYENKINSENIADFCFYEFNYASNLGLKYLVPIIMEREMKDKNSWAPGRLLADLGGKLYVDFSEALEKNDAALFQQKCEELHQRIQEILSDYDQVQYEERIRKLAIAANNKNNHPNGSKFKILEQLTEEECIQFFEMKLGCLNIREIWKNLNISITGSDLMEVTDVNDLTGIGVNYPSLKMKTVLKTIQSFQNQDVFIDLSEVKPSGAGLGKVGDGGSHEGEANNKELHFLETLIAAMDENSLINDLKELKSQLPTKYQKDEKLRMKVGETIAILLLKWYHIPAVMKVVFLLLKEIDLFISFTQLTFTLTSYLKESTNNSDIVPKLGTEFIRIFRTRFSLNLTEVSLSLAILPFLQLAVEKIDYDFLMKELKIFDLIARLLNFNIYHEEIILHCCELLLIIQLNKQFEIKHLPENFIEQLLYLLEENTSSAKIIRNICTVLGTLSTNQSVRAIVLGNIPKIFSLLPKVDKAQPIDETAFDVSLAIYHLFLALSLEKDTTELHGLCDKLVEDMQYYSSNDDMIVLGNQLLSALIQNQFYSVQLKKTDFVTLFEEMFDSNVANAVVIKSAATSLNIILRTLPEEKQRLQIVPFIKRFLALFSSYYLHVELKTALISLLNCIALDNFTINLETVNVISSWQLLCDIIKAFFSEETVLLETLTALKGILPKEFNHFKELMELEICLHLSSIYENYSANDLICLELIEIFSIFAQYEGTIPYLVQSKCCEKIPLSFRHFHINSIAFDKTTALLITLSTFPALKILDILIRELPDGKYALESLQVLNVLSKTEVNCQLLQGNGNHLLKILFTLLEVFKKSEDDIQRMEMLISTVAEISITLKLLPSLIFNDETNAEEYVSLFKYVQLLQPLLQKSINLPTFTPELLATVLKRLILLVSFKEGMIYQTLIPMILDLLNSFPLSVNEFADSNLLEKLLIDLEWSLQHDVHHRNTDLFLQLIRVLTVLQEWNVYFAQLGGIGILLKALLPASFLLSSTIPNPSGENEAEDSNGGTSRLISLIISIVEQLLVEDNVVSFTKKEIIELFTIFFFQSTHLNRNTIMALKSVLFRLVDLIQVASKRNYPVKDFPQHVFAPGQCMDQLIFPLFNALLLSNDHYDAYSQTTDIYLRLVTSMIEKNPEAYATNNISTLLFHVTLINYLYLTQDVFLSALQSFEQLVTKGNGINQLVSFQFHTRMVAFISSYQMNPVILHQLLLTLKAVLNSTMEEEESITNSGLFVGLVSRFFLILKNYSFQSKELSIIPENALLIVSLLEDHFLSEFQKKLQQKQYLDLVKPLYQHAKRFASLIALLKIKDVTNLQSSGQYTLQQLKEELGFTLEELVHGSDFSLIDFLKDFPLSELLEAGYSLEEMVQLEGMTVGRLAAAGVTAEKLKEYFPVQQIKDHYQLSDYELWGLDYRETDFQQLRDKEKYVFSTGSEDSGILNFPLIQTLLAWFNVTVEFNLLYSLLESEGLGTYFHDSSDSQGAHLLVIRTEEGFILGGYSAVDLQSLNIATNEPTDIEDPTGKSFLFVLLSPEGYSSKTFKPVRFTLHPDHRNKSLVASLGFNFGNSLFSDDLQTLTVTANDIYGLELKSFQNGGEEPNEGETSLQFAISDLECWKVDQKSFTVENKMISNVSEMESFMNTIRPFIIPSIQYSQSTYYSNQPAPYTITKENMQSLNFNVGGATNSPGFVQMDFGGLYRVRAIVLANWIQGGWNNYISSRSVLFSVDGVNALSYPCLTGTFLPTGSVQVIPLNIVCRYIRIGTYIGISLFFAVYDPHSNDTTVTSEIPSNPIDLSSAIYQRFASPPRSDFVLGNCCFNDLSLINQYMNYIRPYIIPNIVYFQSDSHNVVVSGISTAKMQNIDFNNGCGTNPGGYVEMDFGKVYPIHCLVIGPLNAAVAGGWGWAHVANKTVEYSSDHTNWLPAAVAAMSGTPIVGTTYPVWANPGLPNPTVAANASANALNSAPGTTGSFPSDQSIKIFNLNQLNCRWIRLRTPGTYIGLSLLFATTVPL